MPNITQYLYCSRILKYDIDLAYFKEMNDLLIEKGLGNLIQSSVMRHPQQEKLDLLDLHWITSRMTDEVNLKLVLLHLR